MTAPKEFQHALTVDVEDYFQVAAFSSNIQYEDWSKWPLRVERNTNAILDLFDSKSTKATFFILGWVAERCPQLIKEISHRGHEIASHGMTHQLVYTQKPEVFRDETFKSKALIEDLTGLKVRGYRAASYSVTPHSLWALDTLTEAGFEYDSSIFPVHHDRYGMPGAPLNIHTAQSPSGGQLTEFPLTSASFLGKRLPVAGGGYFRIYPYFFSRMMLRKAADELKQPFIFYLHPWEIDPEQPRIPGASKLSRFRHYTNLKRCMPRLSKLLDNFSFTSVETVVDNYKSNHDLDVFDYKQLVANNE